MTNKTCVLSSRELSDIFQSCFFETTVQLFY